MPYGDGTGPMGTGPMTGRGAGYCGGFEAPGYASAGNGRGMGLGRGFRGGGRGRRNRFFAAGFMGGMPYGRRFAFDSVNPADEMQILRNQADMLKQQLKVLEERIAEKSGGKEQE